MDREAIAWYSYSALFVALLVLLVGSRFREPYSDPPVALEFGSLALLLLGSLHLRYFRSEWGEMRRGWVERWPRLRYVVWTEPQTFRRSTVLFLGSLVLTVMVLAIWMIFVAGL